MIYIAVCDDNETHLRYTQSMILDELSSCSIEIELFPSPEKLLFSVQAGEYSPDIAVIDIELGEENGIDVARKLNSLIPSCRIIFLTGYAEYAPECYTVPHVWFVLKSSAEQYLCQALHRALKSFEVPVTDEIGLQAKSRGKNFFLSLDSVLYIDRVARKTRIICRDHIFTVSGSPAELIRRSSASPFFIRCHQGYWVNKRHIEALDKNEFILSGDIHIPISRTYHEEARKCFFIEILHKSHNTGENMK